MNDRPTFHEQIARSDLKTIVHGRSTAPTERDHAQLQAALITHEFQGDYTLFEGGSDHTIVYPVCQPSSVLRFYDNRLSGRAEHVRKISIIPALRDAGWQCDSRVEVLHIYVPQDDLKTAAENIPGKLTSELVIFDELDAVDPFMASIASKILHEVQRPSALSNLMVDHFHQVLALHMLRKYSNFAEETDAYIARPSRVSQAELQPALDFINDNIQSAISLGDLAGLARLSNSDFTRSFKKVMGTTPHQYLMQRRIERARDLLTHTHMSIAEIAYACGFASQSHMTTVFSDKVGVSPGRYRRSFLS